MTEDNNEIEVPVDYDWDPSSERAHSFFIHTAFGHFFNDTLEFFSTYLYPRFEWTVVGTFDKAVEYIKKKNKLSGREGDKPNLPALVLNPSGEFGLADANTGARNLYRFPNLAPKFNMRMYYPIYQDSNLIMSPGFTRVKGEFELIMLCNSFYEYTDMRIFLIQIFGGPDRYITPRWFNSFIILPEELVNYTYTNSETGETYQVDWTGAGAVTELIKTTAKNKLVFPTTIQPLYKMIGMSDGSEKYGGTDKLAEWKLTVSVEYEVEIPTFVFLQSEYLAENANFDFGYGSAYSSNADYGAIKPPINEDTVESSWDSGLEDQENSLVDLPDEADSVRRKEYILENRYYHEITAAEADSTSDILVELPYELDPNDKIKVNGKRGYLKRGNHYKIENPRTHIRIIVAHVDLDEGDIIELYIYKLQWSSTP